MKLAVWMTAAFLAYLVILAACAFFRSVPRARYNAALRQIEEQRRTIDRLLARPSSAAASAVDRDEPGSENP